MVTESTFVLDTAEGPMGVAVKYPVQGGPFPSVLLFHHGPGLDEATHAAMGILAEAGIYVVAFDRYHRLGLFHHFVIHRPDGSFDPDAMSHARAALLNTGDELVGRDVKSVVALVGADPHALPGDIVAFGYCVGARSVILAMAEHPELFRTGVLVHPSFCVVAEPPGADAEGIMLGPSPHHRLSDFVGDQAVLVFIGAEDHIASAEANRSLTDAVARLGLGRVELVAGADHGFGLPGPAWADGGSDEVYRDAIEFIRSR